MYGLKRLAQTLATAAVLQTGSIVLAAGPEINTVAAGGYDLISYHTGKKPLRGNGNHVVEHGGATYLFASDENRKAFAANPDKYLPAYGGYCAFGVAVGKKFNGDPDVWKIVDGRLYLNLDTGIQEKWLADVPGYIDKADVNWRRIRDRAAADL